MERPTNSRRPEHTGKQGNRRAFAALFPLPASGHSRRAASYLAAGQNARVGRRWIGGASRRSNLFAGEAARRAGGAPRTWAARRQKAGRREREGARKKESRRKKIGDEIKIDR
jgi:hypothetical protein